jgi:hypothetical protein
MVLFVCFFRFLEVFGELAGTKSYDRVQAMGIGVVVDAVFFLFWR